MMPIDTTDSAVVIGASGLKTRPGRSQRRGALSTGGEAGGQIEDDPGAALYSWQRLDWDAGDLSLEEDVSAIRLRVSADEDGELRLRGLPIRKGQQADVIVLTDSLDEPSADEATLAILQHDSAWDWLQDPAEDVYTEADVRATPGA
jgi:hypothetical protein